MNDALEFYKQHKDVQLDSRPLPDLPLLEQAKWILQGNGYHWIELDAIFPTAKWQQEAELAEQYYVGHRDVASGEGTHQGWDSCAIHGIDTDKTNVWQTYGYDEEPNYNWTSLGKRTKAIQLFFDSVFPAESFARIRFMRLAAGGWISEHNDYNPVIDMDHILDMPLPINIAVDHPDNCYMTLKDQGCVPFGNGKMFMVNIFNNHSVVNCSDRPRTHIIAHCYLGNKKQEFCKLLIESYNKQHERISKQIH